jgi:hypothetical protein
MLPVEALFSTANRSDGLDARTELPIRRHTTGPPAARQRKGVRSAGVSSGLLRMTLGTSRRARVEIGGQCQENRYQTSLPLNWI